MHKHMMSHRNADTRKIATTEMQSQLVLANIRSSNAIVSGATVNQSVGSMLGLSWKLFSKVLVKIKQNPHQATASMSEAQGNSFECLSSVTCL